MDTLPTIRLAGLILTEPATLLTDYIMAALAAFWAGSLRKSARPGSAESHWSLSFACLSFTSFVGGTYHGFQQMIPSQAEVLWKVVLAGASFTSYYLLSATVTRFLAAKVRDFWMLIARVKLILALVLGLLHPIFLTALLDFTLGMVFVFIFAIPRFRRHRQVFLYFTVGVVFFLAGGLVQQMKWAPHFYFNHNDLFHVIQLLGNYMFYRCARKS